MSIPTLLQFIETAFMPVGHTMYIYGGGWNESDTAAGIEARSLGESPAWKSFFKTQNRAYDYKKFLHCAPLGLDCTGYIGWVIYNTFNNENGHEGYVYSSDNLGSKLSERGLGSVCAPNNVTNRQCGDIFYSKKHRHAYICLGECCDRSVLLIHSSPPGVMLSGTSSPNGCGKSEAQKLAACFMRRYYPEWSIKYPCTDRGCDYLSDYYRFRFYKAVLADPQAVSSQNPFTVLSLLK